MSLVVPSAPSTAGQERRVKRGLRGFFQKYFSSFPDSPSSSAPPSPRGASPGASFRPSRRRRADDSAARGSNGNSPSASRPVTPLRSHHPPSGVTVADRPITQPRLERSQRRRRRRRTQSPVGLPIYSEQPTENEMSLFKSHDDAFPAHGIYEEEDEDDDEDDDDDDDEDGQEEIEGEQSDANDAGGGIMDGAAAALEDEDSDAFFAMPPRQSFDTTLTDSASRRRSATNLTGTGGDGSGRPTLRGRPRAASEPLGPRLTQQTTRSSLSRSVITSNASSNNSPYLHGSSSPFASRSGLIELPPRPPSPPSPIAESPGSSSIRGFSFRPSYFTHRSSRSSPVFLHPDASSTTTRPPPLPTSASTGSFGGGGGGGRPRASTLQKLMSSSAGTSNASLTPPSGFEPASWGSGASPYGSLGTRASGSQVSVGGRSISAPLANSFVHSSFVFPKTGPTPEQVAFISSRQAIGAYGYGAGASPPPALNIALSNHPQHRREREDEPAATASTTDEGADRQQGLIAPVPVHAGRGRSGSEASRMSAGGSPLARTVQLPELDFPVHRDELETDAADASDAAAAAAANLAEPAEEDASSSLDPATLAPTLPPLPTLDSITSGLSFSLADDEDGGDEPAALGAANSLHPRQPPAITTSAPTPTASAFPSPVVASHPSFTSNEPV